MKPQAGWMKPDETTGGVDETTWDGGQGALKAETRGLTTHTHTHTHTHTLFG